MDEMAIFYPNILCEISDMMKFPMVFDQIIHLQAGFFHCQFILIYVD